MAGQPAAGPLIFTKIMRVVVFMLRAPQAATFRRWDGCSA